jgi:hypothetical protein
MRQTQGLSAGFWYLQDMFSRDGSRWEDPGCQKGKLVTRVNSGDVLIQFIFFEREGYKDDDDRSNC